MEQPAQAKTPTHGSDSDDDTLAYLRNLVHQHCTEPMRPAPSSEQLATDVFVAPSLCRSLCMPEVADGDLFTDISALWTDLNVTQVVLESPIPGAGCTTMVQALGRDPPQAWKQRFDLVIPVPMARLLARLPAVLVQGIATPRTVWPNVLPTMLDLLGVGSGDQKQRATAALLRRAVRILWVFDGIHDAEHRLRQWCESLFDAHAYRPSWLCNTLILARVNRLVAVPPPEATTQYYTLRPWTPEQGDAFALKRFPHHDARRTMLARSMDASLLPSYPMYWHLVSLLTEVDCALDGPCSLRELFSRVEQVKQQGGSDLEDWHAVMTRAAVMSARPGRANPSWAMPDGQHFVHQAWRDYYRALFLTCDVNIGPILEAEFVTHLVTAFDPSDLEGVVWVARVLPPDDARRAQVARFVVGRMVSHYGRIKQQGIITKSADVKAFLRTRRQRETIRHLCSVDLLAKLYAELADARYNSIIKDDLIGAKSWATGGKLVNLRCGEKFSPYRLEMCCMESAARWGAVHLIRLLKPRNANMVKGSRQEAVLGGDTSCQAELFL